MKRIGVGALLLFIAIRLINIYGDGAPWSVQKTGKLIFSNQGVTFLELKKASGTLQVAMIGLKRLMKK